MPRQRSLYERIAVLGRTEDERRLLVEGLRLFLESEEGFTVEKDVIANQSPECFSVPRSLIIVALAAKRALEDDRYIDTDSKRAVAVRMNNALWRELLGGIAGKNFL
jgi:hypothetical protein